MDTIDTIMKNIVNLRIHIAPVGFEIDRIIIPATSQKADKVWLIAHDNVSNDKAVQYREKIEKELEQKGIKTEVVYANRLRLFPIIKTVTDIILKERKNDVYVNVASGSKIHAIGCMMACMMFDDREKIHPFYAQAEKYPEYDGTLQQTYGVAEVYPLPTYRIGTPKPELIKAMSIIKKAGGRIRKRRWLRRLRRAILSLSMQRNRTLPRQDLQALTRTLYSPWWKHGVLLRLKK